MGKIKLSKNNKNLLLILFIVVVVGLAILYYLNIRNQESFSDNKLKYSSYEEVSKLIKDKNNFVLVFHKMEGCGHCDEFAPKWSEFTDDADNLVKGNKNVKCVVVDAQNKLSEDVSGFPTVRYYKSESDKITFEGPRTVDGLVEFVKEHMK